jgi:hypothetical protein
MQSFLKSYNFSSSRKLSKFHKFWRFITMFAKTHNFSLSSARLIQYTSSIISLISVFFTVSYRLCLGLTSGVATSGFQTKTLYAFLCFPIRATRLVHLILDLITLMVFGGRPGSAVCISTGYGLGIESRWWRDFPPVQTDPGTNQPPVQWVPGLSRG